MYLKALKQYLKAALGIQMMPMENVSVRLRNKTISSI